ACPRCFSDTAATAIYTLSLHDALPIWTVLVEQVQKVFHVFLRDLESRTGLWCSSVAGASCAPCPRLRPQFSSSSMLIASERISLTRTLKDSGMPATISYSPSTMFLYIWLRPCTSSDFTVSISCMV